MEGLHRLSFLTQGPTVPFYFLFLVLLWIVRTAIVHSGKFFTNARPEFEPAESEQRRLPWLFDRLLAVAILLASWSMMVRMLGLAGASFLACGAALCFCWVTGILDRLSWLVESASEWLSRWSEIDSSALDTAAVPARTSESDHVKAARRRRLWRTSSNDDVDTPIVPGTRSSLDAMTYHTARDKKSWWPVAVASLVLALLIVFVLWRPRDGLTEPVTANTPKPTGVQPVNQPLAIAEIEEQTVNEGQLVCLKIGVQNAENIRSRLRYSLGPHSPTGAQIDAETGVFSWTPTEEDGPGIYPILVRVEDSRSEELAESALLVRVSEVNDPLELDEIEDQSVEAGETLTIVATARDPNIPPRDLRYSLGPGAPRGMTIDGQTGALSWATAESQAAGEFPVTVRVREAGRGSLCTETQCVITVTRPDPPAVVVAAVKELSAAMEEPIAPPVAKDGLPARPEAMDEPAATTSAVAAADEPPALVAMPVSNQPEAPLLLPVAMTEPPTTLPFEPPTPVTNSIGMTLVPITDGEFHMGSRESAEDLGELVDRPADRFQDELPLHTVRITRPFFMSKHEVTVGNFREFVLAEGYITEAERHDHGGYGFDSQTSRFERAPRFTWENPGWPQTDDHPVVNVSWNDAVEFCRWLSRKEGREYGLPTEAQWEYACRAGTDTWYSTGDSTESLASGAHLGDEQFRRKVRPNYHPITLASHQEGQSFTVPVGQFEPNGFGLCDMHGNVFEWCSDWYDPGFYAESPPTDPTGPSNGRSRTIRGGGFYSSPFYCRSAYRNGLAPETTVPYLGFRVVFADE